MKIICEAMHVYGCEPTPVFELIVDTTSFPACFTGYGLIPAIRSIRLAEPLAVGVIRHIHNADNSVLTEQVSVLDKPNRHSYSLSGFQAPFSWLVRQGESDWQLRKLGNGTQVRWTYQFILASTVLYPLSYIVLKVFMQRAMKRCLQNMAEHCRATEKAH